MAVPCPVCGGKTKTTKSRQLSETLQRRRYRCGTCFAMFNVHLVLEVDMESISVSQNNS